MLSSKKFLILAGGFGTRIADTIGGLPKVLAPVHDKPFLFYQMNNWVSQGIKDFTFLLHYKAELIIEFLENYKQHNDSQISYNFILEEKPLGTGGAILHAVVSSNIDSFVVINADTWIESGFKESFEAIKPSILTTNVNNAARFGRVNVDSENLVLSFDEKDGFKTPGLINAGLFSLTRDILESVQHKNFSLELEVLKPLAKTQNLQAIISNANFFDIGVPEDLNSFREYILKTQLT